MKRQDLEKLFKRIALDESLPWESEIKEVAAGKKAMFAYLVPRKEVERVSDDGWMYDAIVKQALAANLRTIVEKAPPQVPLQLAQVFVVRPGEEWRIPAYSFIWSALRRHRWNDASEQFEKAVLGWSEKTFADRMAVQKWRQADWNGATYYSTIPADAKAELAALGMRAISPSIVVEGLPICTAVSTLEMRRDAFGLIPKSDILIRFAVDPDTHRGLVAEQKRSKGEFVWATVNASNLSRVNGSLMSQIQHLSREGWT